MDEIQFYCKSESLRGENRCELTYDMLSHKRIQAVAYGEGAGVAAFHGPFVQACLEKVPVVEIRNWIV